MSAVDNITGEATLAVASAPDLEKNKVEGPKRGPGRPKKERPEPKPPTADEQRLAAARAEDYMGEPHVQSEKRYHVHFLTDGLTLAGKVWSRGEEFQPRPYSTEYDLLFDNEGRCILDMSDEEQVERYGEVAWGHGKWPGPGYDPNAKFDDGTPMSVQDQERLAKLNKTRSLQPAATPR